MVKLNITYGAFFQLIQKEPQSISSRHIRHAFLQHRPSL
jgi:hypothetical protein